MATGDAPDIQTRLRRNLPRWFGNGATPAPVLDSLLGGLAWALSGVYDLYAFAKLQTRVATSTGGWLDLTAFDYFGAGLPRGATEADVPYSLRIRREGLRDRNTRGAIDAVVYELTGKHPLIYEGFHAAETGGWGAGFAFGGPGRWGDDRAPFSVIVEIPYPDGYGFPFRGGWGVPVGGWGAGNFSFVGVEDLAGVASLRTIVDAIEQVRAAGTVIHVAFYNPVPPTQTDIPPVSTPDIDLVANIQAEDGRRLLTEDGNPLALE